MNACRFKLIKLDKLLEIADDEIVDDSRETRAIVREAQKYQNKSLEQPLVNEIQNMPRGNEGYYLISNEKQHCPDSISGDKCGNKIYMSSVHEIKMHQSPINANFVDNSLSMVQVNNHLFLFALLATDTKKSNTITIRYDANTREWKKYAPMPLENAWPSSVAKLGDDIYVMIGRIHNGLRDEKRVMKYEIPSDKWVNIEDCPNHVSGSAATGCVINSNIYVSGGILNSKNVSAFDTKAGLWMAVEPLNHARCNHLMENIGDKIFVLGGQTEDRDRPEPSIEVHDILTGQWTVIQNVGLEVSNSASVVKGDQIHILGGRIDNEPSSDIYIFHTKDEKMTKHWKPLPTPLQDHVGGLLTLPQLL